MILFLFILTSCLSDSKDTSTSIDRFDNIDFYEGLLEPQFYHANALWSGVALLDYDNDEYLDIYFTNGHSHSDALYKNNGDGTFSDVTRSAGLGSTKENGAVVAGDIDNDGDVDLIVNTSCSATTLSENGGYRLDGNKILYINKGNGYFEEQPFDLSDSGVLTYCTYSLTLADMNNDGYLDLISSNGVDTDTLTPWGFEESHEGSGTVIFYNNRNGNFTSTSEIIGTSTTFSSIHTDMNGDGLPDLILGQMGREIEVYIQESNNRFTLYPSMSHTGRGLWMGMTIADYNGDSSWNLYATNQGVSTFFRGYDNFYQQLPNGETKMMVSLPNFEDSSEREDVLHSLNPFHSIFDFESGLKPSKVNWTLEHPDTKYNQSIAKNVFINQLQSYHYWNSPTHFQQQKWAWGVASLDVDGDGHMDIVYNGNFALAPLSIIGDEQRGASPGGLLLNQAGVGFVDITWESGVANINSEGEYVDGRGVAVGDLNNDGFADIVFANRSYNPSDSNPNLQSAGVPRIWLSETRDNHFLHIVLEGNESNREGIGAEVQVRGRRKNKKYTYTQWMRKGGEFASSSESALYFGLPKGIFDDDQVDVEVNFPSGTNVIQENIDLNKKIVISE